MKVVIDIECNALHNPTEIWLIVCKDIDTNQLYIFRNLTTNDAERTRFLGFASSVEQWIGHNILGYDANIILNLLGADIKDQCLDTLILSKLIDYPRNGHSIESYGNEFGFQKGSFHKWGDKELLNPESLLFKELEEYCVRDTDICLKVYLKYYKYLSISTHIASISLEHKFQLIVNQLETNGFSFNVSKANKLLTLVTNSLLELDTEILKEFPPKLKLIREITPKVTKHGTLSKTDFRFVTDGDLSIYNGGPFCRCEWVAFNPSSHKQLIEVLNAAGWRPTDKTQTHIETERELNRLKHSRGRASSLDLAALSAKIETLKISGFKINETNLETLPLNASSAAKSLAKRILLESRRRTLTEWLDLVDPVTERIHGRFYGIGAWTHRMAHQAPNTANIPNEFDTQDNVKLLGKEMRCLWRAPKNKLLVGVDAEGIQLRIFAHYINDPEFTDALVRGSKADKSDPHSLNQRILGSVCRSRQAAKRFIYALLLGAGLQKLSSILECSDSETKDALARLMERYTGWQALKDEVFPRDASRGYIVGLDGRRVRIPGDTVGNRKHLCMSGYLQNGEAIVIKSTAVKASPILRVVDERVKLVNIVHDEYVYEVPNDVYLAEKVKDIVCQSIEEVGKELNLNCPLKGDGGYGTSWYQIH